MNVTRTLLVGGSLVFALACGGDTEHETTATSPATAQPSTADSMDNTMDDMEWADSGDPGAPIVRAVRLSPENPVSGGTIRAKIDFAGPRQHRQSAQYTWTVAGEEIENAGAAIELPELHRGDVVSVSVVVNNESGNSRTVRAEGTVPNQPPRIRSLDIAIEEDPDEGEVWTALADGDDPDGDELDYQYVWLVNGAASTVQEPSFPTRLLQAGDRIRVRVIASDGHSESNPAESGTVGVANSAPEILSTPPGLDARGEFRYTIEARDPEAEGDLEYELISGPQGMEMDSKSGLLVWTPREGQSGDHEVEFAVSDASGGRSTQVFVLPIVMERVDRQSLPARHD